MLKADTCLFLVIILSQNETRANVYVYLDILMLPTRSIFTQLILMK